MKFQTIESDQVYIEFNLDDDGRLHGDSLVVSSGHVIAVPATVLEDFMKTVWKHWS